MPIGNDKFQAYCNENGIPNSSRIWAWAMWCKAFELGKKSKAFTKNTADKLVCEKIIAMQEKQREVNRCGEY